jgi:hypothetical protein
MISANATKKGYLQFLSTLIHPSIETVRPDCFQTFEHGLGGFMKLWVKPHWERDELETIFHEGVDYSIISGCWVHPLAASILRNREANHICCLMMDTTWSIMRQYVTAICIAVAYNTAIPLAFSFGRVEDSGLYNIFWDAFSNRFYIDLSGFRIESDQGSGLAKFAREHTITQRYCLRHFLATLKDRVFSVYVHYLVKARTEMEFAALCDSYRIPLHNAIGAVGSTGLKRAKQEFGKAGLSVEFVSGEAHPRIGICDPTRWEQVSTIVKFSEHIPTTTNSLEAINGHRNHDTPRNNTFWASLARTARMIGRGIECFSMAVRRNFNFATRRAAALRDSIGAPEMEIQKAFYHTNIATTTCDCGITPYWTIVYGIPFPCCHLLHAGMVRPRMRNPPVLTHSLDPLCFSFSIEKTPRAGQEPTFERREALIEIAAHSIKYLSHTGMRLPDIVHWVEENFPPMDDTVLFVNNVPIPVLLLISAGVLNCMKDASHEKTEDSRENHKLENI